jgi:hypothetical protein
MIVVGQLSVDPKMPSIARIRDMFVCLSCKQTMAVRDWGCNVRSRAGRREPWHNVFTNRTIRVLLVGQ